MDFLRYIEYDAENLQFYLWYKGYCERFQKLSDSEKKLASEWTAEQALAERTMAEKEKLPKKMANNAAAVFKGTDFDSTAKIGISEAAPNPFNTPPRTPSAADHESMVPSTIGYSEDATTLRAGTIDHGKRTEAAFEDAGTLQPCMFSNSPSGSPD